jgi:hypothetical protein
LIGFADKACPENLFCLNGRGVILSARAFISRFLRERSDPYVCKPDVCHSMRRAARAYCDKVAANQPLILHGHESLKHIFTFFEVLEMVNTHRQHPALQERVYLAQNGMNQFLVVHSSTGSSLMA